MSAGSTGIRQIAICIRPASKNKHICLSCRQTLSRRNYASAATATLDGDTPSSPPQLTPDPPLTASPPQTRYTISAAIVLSRPPIVTPQPHPFESAYFLYQRRLNERLVLPFSQYFYYKRQTPAFEDWRAKRRERAGTAARDIGVYSAYGTEGWNDEVLVGSQDGNPEEIVKKLVEEEGRGAEFVPEGRDSTFAGLRRTTGADEYNDQKSLERSLSRTLYLLVKKPQTGDKKRDLWVFPTSAVTGKEGLKEAAQRALASACGVNMNTWFIANHPIGHLVSHNRSITESSASSSPQSSQAPVSTPEAGEKIFFMKGRILAGQADVKGNVLGVDDFRWLAKEEIQRVVTPFYWAGVKNMLVEQ